MLDWSSIGQVVSGERGVQVLWTSEDVARDQVRRQAAGMTAQQVARAVDEAAVRVRETREALRSPSAREGEEAFAPDPEELADRWKAKLAEWQRVAHLAASGSGVYDGDGDGDAVGATWAREREERRTGALRAHAAWMDQRREEREGLRSEVWLSGAAGRRVRAVAAQTGLTPQQVLDQLTERVAVGEDGVTVSVAPFVPGHLGGAGSEER